MSGFEQKQEQKQKQKRDHATIEQMLGSYMKETAAVTAPNRDEKLLEILQKCEKKNGRSDFPDFAIGQLHGLGRYSLFWELLWLAAFVFLILTNRGTNTMLVVSMMVPLLLIIAATDLSKVMNQSMLEIEATTKYSLPQILLFRILTHELIQLLLVLIGVLLCRNHCEQSLTQMLLYGYTPLILSSALLLLCISHFSGKALQYAGFAIAIMVGAVVLSLTKQESVVMSLGNIFDVSWIWAWKLILGISTAGYVIELWVIRREVYINGIGTGRSIEML